MLQAVQTVVRCLQRLASARVLLLGDMDGIRMGGRNFSEGEMANTFLSCVELQAISSLNHRVGTSEKPGVAGLGTPHLPEEEMGDEVGVESVKQEQLGELATACLPSYQTSAHSHFIMQVLRAYVCLALRDTKLTQTPVLVKIMAELILGEADRHYLAMDKL